MMKRLTAICLVLMMLCTATAYAAGWEDGLGPHKPYRTAREIDLTTQVGYMMFHPNANMSVAGAKTLFIYLPREDVELNADGGNFVIRSADQGEEYRIAVNDPKYVTLRPMIDWELEGLLFGGGVCVEITLPVSLRLGCTYYVDMDAGCIVVPNAETPITHEAMSGEEHWHFETIGDYGVSQLEYRRVNGSGEEETVVGVAQDGDTARFDLVLGGAAKSATLYKIGNPGDPEKIVFPTAVITESCEIIGQVTGEDPAWGVLFWDTETPPVDPNEAANHLVDSLMF